MEKDLGKTMLKSFSEKSVKVLSFNVLADLNCSREFFPYVEPGYLDFAYRAPRIVEMIKNHNPDILCLQEVDHYDDYYQGKFCEMNYRTEIVYKGRWGREGLLVGWKSDRFKLMQTHVRNFDTNHDYERYYEFQRGNKACFIRLREIRTGLEYIIINVHLYWDPAFEHVKLHQLTLVLDIIMKKYSKSDRIILCGDFNSEPTSNTLRLLENMALGEYQTPNPQAQYVINAIYNEYCRRSDKVTFLRNIFTDDEPPAPALAPPPVKPVLETKDVAQGVLTTYDQIGTPTTTASTPKDKDGIITPKEKEGTTTPPTPPIKELSKEFFTPKKEFSRKGYPDFTNYTPGFKGVIDHIYFNREMLRCVARCQLPTKEQFKHIAGIPNKDYPSDHLPLLCIFEPTNL